MGPLAVQRWFAEPDFLLENLKIQTHVIETAWRSGVRRRLFLGSSCIDPKFAEQPIRQAAQRPEQGAGTTVTCWGSGTPLREFLHVDDLGEACVFALERWDPAAAGAPRATDPAGEDLGPLVHLNVGTGLDLSIRELAEQVAAATGFAGTIRWDASKPDGTPKKQPLAGPAVP